MRITHVLTLVTSLATTDPSRAFTTPSTSIRTQNHKNGPPIIASTASPTSTRSTNNNRYRYLHSGPITTRLHMGWGPDPIWSTGFVSQTIQACPSGSCVSLKVQVEDGTGFRFPGQYVQVRPSGADDETKPLFLAIASAPTGTISEADEAAGGEAAPVPATWEFLVKKTDNNAWLTEGVSSIEISQPMGNGFPMKENLEGFKYDFPTQNLLLFATGSGIAPIRSAIESQQLNIAPPGSGGRTCTLYYGVRTPDDMSYVSKFPEWESSGVQVVPVVSQPDLPCESGTVWNGRTGYIQNALEEDGVPIPRNSGALLCGVKGMCESVSGMLKDANVFEGRILTNF